MSTTPLTDNINTLITYTNSVTGKTDTTLSDAVYTLAQGYGQGGSSWTKIAETSYTVNTTSTSTETVATFETGDSSIWTSNKIVYVRIRDTRDKRTNYFYGSDSFYFNINPINNDTTASYITPRWNIWMYTGSEYRETTSAYGVYASNLYPNGNIKIGARYNNLYSGCIESTYTVEVYLLDMPTDRPIFT